jgi:hypothetical protein
MSVNRLKQVAGITIPDSKIATQATELLLEHGTAFIYNHSLRVFLFSSLKPPYSMIWAWYPTIAAKIYGLRSTVPMLPETF